MLSKKNLKIAFGIAVLLLAVNVGWQFSSAEIANAELQDDMRDLASQASVHIGLADIPTDEQLRDAILHKADKYNIPLNAEQITVEHTGSGKDTMVYLAADYDMAIQVANYSYIIHFDPASPR